VKTGMKRSQRIALIAVFATITTVLDTILTPGFSSGVWYGWVFVMSPINGIILGPRYGFITTLISVLAGHTIVFRDSIYEYIFTIGAPIGALISGLIFKGKNRLVLGYYALLLCSFFLNPVGRSLPFWGMWDVYVAFVILLGMFLFEYRIGNIFGSSPRLAATLGTLIGLEADILFRIFVLVPLGGYEIFYGLTQELLAVIWALPAPLITPLKVCIALLISSTLVPSILKYLKTEKNHP
jgi:hypothetical protein